MEIPAFRSRGVRWAACGVTALILAADQLSKSLVIAARPRAGSGLVAVRLVRNTGASFGVGSGHPALVMVFSAVVIAVAAAMMARTSSRVVALFLAVVLGGALGNLADRLLRSPGLARGAVIDWIHLAWYPASFNVADVAVRAGAVGAIAAILASQTHLGRRLSRQQDM